VDRIQIGAAFIVVEILPVSLHYVQRSSVGSAQRGADVLAPAFQDLLRAKTRGREAVFRDSKNQIRIGADAQPDLALARGGDPRKISLHAEHIGNDLKMKMRR